MNMLSDARRLRRILTDAAKKVLAPGEEWRVAPTSVKVFLKSGGHIDVGFRFLTDAAVLALISRDGAPQRAPSFDIDLIHALRGDEFIDDETQINMLVLQLTERWNK